MSDIAEEMLRTLDRIVEDTLTPTIRETMETGSGGGPRTAFEAALEESGLTAVGGTGADDDVTLEDAMALVRRLAYHAVPLPVGEAILARWLAHKAGLPAPETAPALMVAACTADDLVKLPDDGRTISSPVVSTASGHDGPVLVAGEDGQGRQHLAWISIGGITVMLKRTPAGERRDHFHFCAPEYDQRVIAQVAMPDALARLRAAGAMLRSVQIAGAMERTLDHGLTWTSDRIQFGRPIAKHQAVQHLMAQLAEETAAAGAAADLAIAASADGPDPLACAIAKSRTGEAAGKGANIVHAAFGAMGFTREHPLHFTTRRLWSWRNEFGSEVYWQGEIGRRVATGGSQGLWSLLTSLPG